MQTATYRGPSDIRIEDTPEPAIEAPTDAIVRITHTAICGSDLWFYRGKQDYEEGAPVGHEPMGIVEEVGEEVRHVEPGDRVFAPFWISCLSFARWADDMNHRAAASWNRNSAIVPAQYRPRFD